MSRRADELAGEVLDKAGQETNRSVLTLVSGAVVEARPVPDMVLQALFSQYPESKPPILETEVRGKMIREANLSDPDYIAAVEARDKVLSDAMLNLTLLRGLKVLQLPPDVVAYEEDNEWEEELSDLGIEIPTKKTLRRLLWLRYRVAISTTDLVKLQEESMRLSGVSEEEIQAAMQRFQREREQDADTPSTADDSAGTGDQV